MSQNLFAVLEERFPQNRDTVVIDSDDGRLFSYGELEAICGRYASLLASLGVEPGDRVAVQVEKCPEAVFLYLACVRMGAIYLPLNTAYQRHELEYFLADAEPKAVVCRPESEPAFAALIAAAEGAGHERAVLLTLGRNATGSLVERAHGLDPDFTTYESDEDDIAAILYTSGTTGRSKGAMLSHRNLAANALTLHHIWGFEPGDRLIHALPIYHVHGLFVAVNTTLANGTGMKFLEKFDPDRVIELFKDGTVLMGVPTFYTRLLAHPRLSKETTRRMRLFIAGSAPLLAETHRAFEARTGHKILERYGMTETGMLTSNPLHGERIPGSVGLPLPELELKIRDENGQDLPQGEIGMIEVRGPNVFKGYWRMPEKTAAEIREDGFFITGDLGRIEASGYVTIVGRGKDLVISGGLNVYPKEVELLIDEIPGVEETAVIGIAHPDFGEAVVAVVKRAADEAGAALDEAAVVGRLKGEIAVFKLPKGVLFVDELPRNAMGKVQKALLREQQKALFGAG